MATPFQWARNSIARSLVDQQGMLLLAACRTRNHTRPTNHQQCLRQPTTSRGEPTERSSSNIVVRNRWVGQRETVPPRSYHGGAFFLPDLWPWRTRLLVQETRIVPFTFLGSWCPEPCKAG
ncbi:hypothetical protein HZ326_31251 [Fusarium oxysporum f. sp. albedinis]|nr:hypothetical protein HZ326_31251 [Fusarium oxysporum f. sp. albedinis]